MCINVLVEIPEDVIEVFITEPDTSRDKLKAELGISDHFARIYTWAMQYGNKVYHHELKTKPEGGTKKAGLLPDIHFPYHDERALDIAINHLLRVGIDVLVVQGDGVDCYAVSFWKTDPTKPIFSKEVEQAVPLIRKLSGAFPGVEKVWLEGNHELRLRNELWGGSRKLAGLRVLTIPKLYELEDAGFSYTSNWDSKKNNLPPLKIGNISILHGHEVKLSGMVVNPARGFYLKNPMTQVIAHFHRGSEHLQNKLSLETDGSWSLGCLCDLTPDYAVANQWNHGFGIIEWDSDGYFSLSNKKIIDGRVL